MDDDRHAAHREAKRRAKARMAVSGRSAFTVERAEAKRAEELERKGK